MDSDPKGREAVKRELHLLLYYTRMLRMALGVSWRDMIPNNILYGNLPKLTDKIRERRLKVAGHCYRHPELVAQKLTLWRPQQGNRSRGGRTRDYVDTLLRDTETESVGELSSLMESWLIGCCGRSYPESGCQETQPESSESSRKVYWKFK